MKKLLKFVLFVSFALLISTQPFAGHEVGNGGNVIVCKDTVSKKIASVELLDYFELRQSGGTLKLDPALGNYSAMLKDLFKSWKPVAPKRMAQYEQWLNEFEGEAGIYSGIAIPPTEDTGIFNMPIGCEIAPVVYQRPEEELFPGVKRYTINKDFWELLSETDKAGLILHELIYREGIAARHGSSFPTRYFNRYLASAVPDAMEYALVVQKMPLEWVEFGQGLVIWLGNVPAYPTQSAFQAVSKITDDGFIAGRDYNPNNYQFPFSNYQRGSYLGIIGDVSSKHLNIHFKSLNHETNHLSGMIEVSHEKVFLNDLSYGEIESLGTSIDGLNFDFIQLPAQLAFFQMDNIKKHLQITIRGGTERPEALNVDPATSSFVQADGSVIQSISKIVRNAESPSNNPQVPFTTYGNSLVASSGDTWVYSLKKGLYIKN